MTVTAPPVDLGRRPHLLGTAWPPVPLLVTVGVLAAGFGLELTAGSGRVVNPFLPVIAGTAMLYGVLGHLIAGRHAGHPIARLLQLAGLLGATVVLAGGHANAALFGPLPDTGAAVTLWISRWMWIPATAAATLGVLLLFPDGRLPSRRWRPVALLTALGPLLLTLHFASLPFEDSVWQEVPVGSPVGPLPGVAQQLLEGAAQPAWILAVAVGSAAVLVRWHRADATERGRFALVVWPAVLLPVALVASASFPAGGLAEMVVGTALPITVAVAMLRHRLFDVDVVLNRAVVHGLLVVSLFGAYVSVMALVSQLVGGDVSWPAGAVAAVVIAALTAPLLTRLRSGVDRLMYGDRDRPDAVAGRLAVATGGGVLDDRPTDVLGAAARALQEGLRVPWVRVEIGDAHGAAGEPRTEGHEVLIGAAGRPLGRLLVGARWDGERRTAADELALGAAARQLAVTAEAYLLARRLAEARERVVGAREDERRRIRRDLHDGLGPALAGITAALEGLEAVAATDPEAAAAGLSGLRAQARAAVGDIRRLVDGLRPPALDELGLLGSLREELRLLERATAVAFVLEVPERPPPLSAALEVAALRIVLEAATNVVRHAAATRCTVRLSVDDRDMTMQVDDDGCGVAADAVPGVGLSSMRERAEEVGGTLTVSARPEGGTRVCAVLPLLPRVAAAS